ncbi:MAG: sortase [bacterium]|nr:sortase [bacterium]
MTNSNVKLICISVCVAIAVSTGLYFILRSQPAVETLDSGNRFALVRPDDQLFGWQYPVARFPEAGPVKGKLAYSTIRDPGGLPQGLPVRLKIPTIGVDSAIEDALITPDGRMDVPYGSVNVAWFSLGPKPGHKGSAVIGGHFGISNGVKFVFYDLDKLTVGDRIYILDDDDNTLAFQVRRIELFERNADATAVFTSNDGLAHLNLITCEGIWNRVDDTYPLRRVIFTDAVSAEDPVEVSATSPNSLSIGDQGAAVAELQAILIEKGFLVIPRGVSKGYFGTLTRTATITYQISVGLPSTGIFDSATREKLTSVAPTEPTIQEKLVVTTEPPLPRSVLPSEPAKSQSFFEGSIEYIKSLYATSKDGLITSVLLVLILIFTAYAIKK